MSVFPPMLGSMVAVLDANGATVPATVVSWVNLNGPGEDPAWQANLIVFNNDPQNPFEFRADQAEQVPGESLTVGHWSRYFG